MTKSVVVIKFGGEVVENANQLENVIASVKALYGEGHGIVLVHGGGPLASKLSKQMSIEPNMVGGRRVTCEKTLEVMKMVLSGVINSNLLAFCKKHDLPAVSASAISFVEATKRPPKVVSGSDGKKVDFGWVGDVLGTNADYLKFVVGGGFIPVVSPLCADKEGQILNINADTIAVHTAKALKAKKFVLVTEVGGVFKNLEDRSSRFHTLTREEGQKLISEKVIQGGMIPKLEESFALLEEQLESFHIVGCDQPDGIVNEIKIPGSIGTAIVNGSSSLS
jgi:acetylglutamate kinase